MTSADLHTPLLQLTDITKKYRKLTAVDALSFSIAPGEFVGFIGPNGAGKSTTMGSIAGVLNPDSGRITVGDVDVLADPIAARKAVSFVPQHLELYGYLTGLEYLQFVAEAKELSEQEQRAQIEELLEMAELTRARHRLIKEYSGGMARKVAICGALLGPPRVLLLDESFVGLDPESTFALQQRLVKFCDEGGAILLSSHILDMLERICTRVVMLVNGKLALDAPMEELRAGFGEPDGPANLTELYLDRAGKLDALAARS
jgi:ABC-2 type transport system ATP-binding protein